MAKSLVEMAADIVSAQIQTQEMQTEDITQALQNVFSTLQQLQNSESTGQETQQESAPPVTDPMKSIQKNKIICLECGESFKMLSPKHLSTHGLTQKEYRQKYGFKARQPLCARALSEKRSAAGKKRGIPDNLRKSIEERRAKQKK